MWFSKTCPWQQNDLPAYHSHLSAREIHPAHSLSFHSSSSFSLISFYSNFKNTKRQTLPSEVHISPPAHPAPTLSERNGEKKELLIFHILLSSPLLFGISHLWLLQMKTSCTNGTHFLLWSHTIIIWVHYSHL